MRAGEHLHLGEEGPRCSEWLPAAAAARCGEPVRPVGSSSSASASTASITASKPARSDDGRTATPSGEPLDQRVVAEQLVDVRPDVGERDDHAAARLVGAAGEPQHPLGGVVAVVVDLLDRLGGDRGERGVGRLGEPARTARTGRAERRAAGRWCGRSRRSAARRARRSGTRARRASRRGRPRCARRRCRRSAAATGRGRAGRGRCCRARRPLRARGRGRSTSRAAGRGQGVVAEPQGVLGGIRRGDLAGAGDAGACELLGERELVDGDVAVRRSQRRRASDAVACGGLAHRCFTPSLFV